MEPSESPDRAPDHASAALGSAALPAATAALSVLAVGLHQEVCGITTDRAVLEVRRRGPSYVGLLRHQRFPALDVTAAPGIPVATEREAAAVIAEELLSKGLLRPLGVWRAGLLEGDWVMRSAANWMTRRAAVAAMLEATNAQLQEHLPTAIVAAATHEGLRPRPSDRTSHVWIAQCPGAMHRLTLALDAERFECTVCGQSGSGADLIEWAARRPNPRLTANLRARLPRDTCGIDPEAVFIGEAFRHGEVSGGNPHDLGRRRAGFTGGDLDTYVHDHLSEQIDYEVLSDGRVIAWHLATGGWTLPVLRSGDFESAAQVRAAETRQHVVRAIAAVQPRADSAPQPQSAALIEHPPNRTIVLPSGGDERAAMVFAHGMTGNRGDHDFVDSLDGSDRCRVCGRSERSRPHPAVLR